MQCTVFKSVGKGGIKSKRHIFVSMVSKRHLSYDYVASLALLVVLQKISIVTIKSTTNYLPLNIVGSWLYI